MPLSIGTCLTSRSSLRKPQATPLRTSKPKCECPLCCLVILLLLLFLCFFCVCFVYLFLSGGGCLKMLPIGQQKPRIVFTKLKHIHIFTYIAFFLVHEQFAFKITSVTHKHTQATITVCKLKYTRFDVCVAVLNIHLFVCTLNLFSTDESKSCSWLDNLLCNSTASVVLGPVSKSSASLALWFIVGCAALSALLVYHRAKLGYGLLSGEYSKPAPEPGEENDAPEPRVRTDTRSRWICKYWV